MTEFYHNAKLELSKVIFPLREQVRMSFISVTLVVSFITILLGIFDFILSSSISSILK